VAVVGAESAEGARIREALFRVGVPGTRVDLYGATGGQAVLSEYGGEARLIQELDLDELRRRDILFLCECEGSVAGLAGLVSSERTIVDLADGLRSDPRRRLVRPDGSAESAPARGAILAVPHELTVLLLDVLLPLERTLGVEDATAVILRPAADFGEAGIEELRQQTVRLLSFESVPRDVFARQLAFNVVAQSEIEDSAFATEQRVASEARGLLEWPTERLSLRIVVVPVFLGHTAQLRVRCAGGGGAEEARSALKSGGVRLAGPGRAAPRTPLEASAEGATTVVDVSDDGRGGVWIWVVAGELPARRAGLAVQVALALSDL